jgi:glycosyltransferase involved in cell wall biosynthesis
MSQYNILMLAASLGLSGTPRILMDLVQGLTQRDAYRLHISYKPEFPGPGNELSEAVRHMGIELHPLRGKHLFSPRGLADLLKILIDKRIDIIHCWDELSIAARFFSMFVGSIVIDSIGNPPGDESPKTRLAKAISSCFLDGVIFQSFGTKDAHFSSGSNILRRCKTAVIYNSIDLEVLPRFSDFEKKRIRRLFGLQTGDIVLMNLGMYNDQKAQEYLIEAMPHLLARDLQVRMLLVGWGEREPLLLERIKTLGLQESIFLTGKKRKNEVFEILSITDIYVSSSLWEGLPLALLEAMSFGIPIVATNVIGNNEAVVDGETGILVPPRDPAALADAMAGLAIYAQKRKEMGNRGYERARDLFSVEKFVQKYVEFYHSILKR